MNRPSEDANFDTGIKDSRELLWHGTHSAHMVSILKDGLQIDARNSRRIGRSLGDVRINFHTGSIQNVGGSTLVVLFLFFYVLLEVK